MSARDEVRERFAIAIDVAANGPMGRGEGPSDLSRGQADAVLALLEEGERTITDQMRAVADWCGQNVPKIPTQTKTRAPGEMPSMLHWLADYVEGETGEVFHEFAGGTYVAPSDDEVQRYATRPLDDFARAIYYLSHDTPFTEAIHHIERYVSARDTLLHPEGDETP